MFDALRVGELLHLRWRDVGLEDHLVVLQAQATKTNTMRVVPVSKHVKAILEMRRHGPDGKALGPDCYVFGTETGERRKSVSHDWNIAVLRAHRHEPTFKRGKLSAASRKVLQRIDLHMHDLRRECGSRCSKPASGFTRSGSGSGTETSAPLVATSPSPGPACNER